MQGEYYLMHNFDGVSTSKPYYGNLTQGNLYFLSKLNKNIIAHILNKMQGWILFNLIPPNNNIYLNNSILPTLPTMGILKERTCRRETKHRVRTHNNITHGEGEMCLIITKIQSKATTTHTKKERALIYGLITLFLFVVSMDITPIITSKFLSWNTWRRL